MRGHHPTMAPINTDDSYRATPDPEGDSQSSSSNSPARADYEESDFYAGNNDSQSSIGVPTFQDMAVSEESCEPPANRLPAEVLIGIFSKLSSPHDLLNCMRVSKRTLTISNPYFAYRDFIKRLNLAALSDRVNDGSVAALQVCKRVERLTLTGCDGLSDGGLVGLLDGNNHLLALDISGDTQITEASMFALAENCKRLQGLNISNCQKISNQSMIAVAENCKYIKRLKLNDCDQLEDAAIMAFAVHCPNILEIDLHQCKAIGNGPVTALLSNGQTLRELRLANCELISDEAFLTLPPARIYEHLRILDLTSCARLTDRAVERIIDVAPRLRNLVFAKCRNLTDVAVNAISKLGKNLHYLHLGHCGHITDQAVIKLVQTCNRIRYIDLGCCVHLTDNSVTKLATLPKLRRIGLVKCANITDHSVYALAQAGPRRRMHPDMGHHYPLSGSSSLERVHLSYCTNLTLTSVIVLLNNCQKLTHLSLTGVQAFLRPDLEQFCREAPPGKFFKVRTVFCVFSGQGVMGLRAHLNNLPLNQPYDALANGPVDDDEDHTMTGTDHATLMMSAAALNADEDDADGDEELDDADDNGGLSQYEYINRLNSSPHNLSDFQKCSINNFLSTGLPFLRNAAPLPISEFVQRRQNLAIALHADGIDAFIVEPGYTFQYYANISQKDWEVWEPEERPFLMVVEPIAGVDGEIKARTRFLCPSFEVERARLLGMPFVNELEFVSWEEHWNPYKTLLESWYDDGSESVKKGIPKIMVDDEMRDFIQRGLGENGFEVVGLGGEVERVKQTKTEREIEILRAVNTGTVEAVREMRKCMYPGLTENEVMEVLDNTLRVAGLEPFFDIVLFDEDASNPHGGTDGTHFYGYSSDICRTFFPPFKPKPTTERELASLSPHVKEKLSVWDVVLFAQTASMVAMHANATAASIDIAARTIISEAGYGGAFTHRVGHGIGIKAHESPYMNKGNTETLLRKGMTFTSEPGVYLVGKFGVRHEDVLLVGENDELPEVLSGTRAVGPWDP
ncbi:hypothetical protein EG329_002205 [Mollisiaceae sp. DMI_Dod_QoI]|nr:hypothetical protein EG329_002205 [Helotiales sp. DMI_Dod_QoI]